MRSGPRSGSRLGSRLGRGRLAADVLEVAPALLGRVLVCDRPEGRVAVRLTEVEAYRGEGDDPGSHAYRGRTPRTAVMFGPPGHLYVYFSYGMHWCANVVCGRDGAASAVLLRAGEVVLGHELARARRPSARTDTELARGPARLTVALGIGPQDDGADLCVPEAAVWLAAGGRSARGEGVAVSSGPRVGVAGPGGDADAFPWRFWLTGDRTVSAYRPGKSPRRAPVGPD